MMLSELFSEFFKVIFTELIEEGVRYAFRWCLGLSGEVHQHRASRWSRSRFMRQQQAPVADKVAAHRREGAANLKTQS
jgi:hypothetical protein